MPNEKKNNGHIVPASTPLLPNGQLPGIPLSGAFASALGHKPNLGQNRPELQKRHNLKSGLNGSSPDARTNSAKRGYVPGKGHK